MVEIKSTENASRASNHDPMTSAFYAFYNACDVASSRASIVDLTTTTE